MISLRVKVCGVCTLKNLQDLAEVGIQEIGLNFYPTSKRFIGNQAETLASAFPKVFKWGVFVNPTLEELKTQVHHLNGIQLHGDESLEFIKEVRSLFPEMTIMKAISIGNIEDIEALNTQKDLAEQVSYLLFDTKGPEKGGNGIKFNWEILERYKLDKPFFLAGGVSEQDTPKIKSLKLNKLIGVDINSKFEISAGVKDTNSVERFIKTLNS